MHTRGGSDSAEVSDSSVYSPVNCEAVAAGPSSAAGAASAAPASPLAGSAEVPKDETLRHRPWPRQWLQPPPPQQSKPSTPPPLQWPPLPECVAASLAVSPEPLRVPQKCVSMCRLRHTCSAPLASKGTATLSAGSMYCRAPSIKYGEHDMSDQAMLKEVIGSDVSRWQDDACHPGGLEHTSLSIVRNIMNRVESAVLGNAA